MSELKSCSMCKRVLILGFFFFLFCAQAGFASGTMRRFVLVAGANFGGPERSPLRYALSDAQNFVQVLEEMGGVHLDDCILLVEPDLAAFHQALDSLNTRVKSSLGPTGRTEVVLYYSGHADEQGLLLGAQRLSYQDLRRRMESIRADVHITVLDACASGAITRLKGGQRQKAFLVDASSDMEGYAFLTSSSEDEAAQESDRIHGSFFTHYLVSGMRGAADVSGDGKVTLGEAYQFAFHETLTRTAGTQGGAQHPAYDIKLSGTGDVVMTDVRQTSAGLILSAKLDGRFFIRNAEQQLVAELYKPAGRSMELGLEPGMYDIRLEHRQSLLSSALELEEGRRLVVEEKDFQPVAREQTALRGGSSGDGEGVKIEILDTYDLALGGDEDYTLSVSFFLNHKRRPFHGLQLSVLFNNADRLAGSQVAAVGNLAHQDLTGFQLTPGANYAGGNVSHAQLAGFANFTESSVAYGQLSGFANFTQGSVTYGQLAGFANFTGSGPSYGQLAGFANFTRGDILYGQLSGFLNFSEGDVSHVQLSGFANATMGRVTGIQVAGFLNTAEQVEGGQAFSTLNMASEVTGFQFGMVNIASRVRGLQIGLVNVSRDIEGIPIGLFNYSRTGLLTRLLQW